MFTPSMDEATDAMLAVNAARAASLQGKLEDELITINAALASYVFSEPSKVQAAEFHAAMRRVTTAVRDAGYEELIAWGQY